MNDELSTGLRSRFPASEEIYEKFLRAKTRGGESDQIEVTDEPCVKCACVRFRREDIFAPTVCMYCGHIRELPKVMRGSRSEWDDMDDWGHPV